MTLPTSPSSLHPSVVRSPEDKAAAERAIAESVAARPPITAAGLIASHLIDIPLDTITFHNNFDAHIEVGYEGSTIREPLIVDSGNSVLIVPRWEAIESIPNWQARYSVLTADDLLEPWKCPAKIVRGPIVLRTAQHNAFTIPDCVFYACTGDNPDGERTGNFGTGCLKPWSASGWNTKLGADNPMWAPLAYLADYPYVEFNYAAPNRLFTGQENPFVTAASHLTLHKNLPPGYTMLDIVEGSYLMSVAAKALTIGTVKTEWPGRTRKAIAVIDTGGGPVFLNDPEGVLFGKQWPHPGILPEWVHDPATCNAVGDDVTIEIGDEATSYRYTVSLPALPLALRKLTLAIFRETEFMRDRYGMNTGGLSALTNSILIDYRNSRVGLKPK